MTRKIYFFFILWRIKLTIYQIKLISCPTVDQIQGCFVLLGQQSLVSILHFCGAEFSTWLCILMSKRRQLKTSPCSPGNVAHSRACSDLGQISSDKDRSLSLSEYPCFSVDLLWWQNRHCFEYMTFSAEFEFLSVRVISVMRVYMHIYIYIHMCILQSQSIYVILYIHI